MLQLPTSRMLCAHVVFVMPTYHRPRPPYPSWFSPPLVLVLVRACARSVDRDVLQGGGVACGRGYAGRICHVQLLGRRRWHGHIIKGALHVEWWWEMSSFRARDGEIEDVAASRKCLKFFEEIFHEGQYTKKRSGS